MTMRQFAADRAALRAAFQRELASLRTEASEGELETEDLHSRLNEIMGRYLGDAANEPGLQAGIEKMLRHYDGLHDAVERQAALEAFARALGVQPPPRKK